MTDRGAAAAGLYLLWRKTFSSAAPRARYPATALENFSEAEAGRWTSMSATLLQNRIRLFKPGLARNSLHVESLKGRLSSGAAVRAAMRRQGVGGLRYFDEIWSTCSVGSGPDVCGNAAICRGSREQKGATGSKVMALLEPAAILVIGV